MENSRLINLTDSVFPISDWSNAETFLSFKTPVGLPDACYMLFVEVNGVISDAKMVYKSDQTSYYLTMVGTAQSWEWKMPLISDTVRSGSASNWSLRTFESGSGRKIPKGNAINWSWVNE